MLQVRESTNQEKFEMYDKLDKYVLIGMLIEANKHLNNIKPRVENTPCFYTASNDTSGRCVYCGKQKYEHFIIK